MKAASAPAIARAPGATRQRAKAGAHLTRRPVVAPKAATRLPSAGLPPLLDFKYETLFDAHGFERLANYALLRITQVGEADGTAASTSTSRPSS